MRRDETQARDGADTVRRSQPIDRAQQRGDVRSAIEIQLAAQVRSPRTWAKRSSTGRSWPYELTFWPSSVTSR